MIPADPAARHAASAVACVVSLLVLAMVAGPATAFPAAGSTSRSEHSPSSGANWTQMSPSGSPPQASGHTMAYDSGSDRVILYGGWNNQTWSYDYDNDSWRRSITAAEPPFTHYCAMAYDAGSDRIVYTGSKTYAGWPTMETWAFDLERDSWANVTPPGSPSARTHHMMSYDPHADRIIMFGGDVSASGATAETWEYDFDSNKWTLLNTTNPPPKRGSGALAYDSESRATVLFGGGDNYRDTWAFHYSNLTWERKDPPTAGTPLGRIYHAMAYDVRSDRILLFGGYIIGGGGARDETHIYDLNNDTWLDPQPSPRPKYSQMTAMAYDSRSDCTIQFGGSGHGDNNDTWAFDDPYEGPPQVLSTSPSDGATGVVVGSNIAITFSTGMATASVLSAISSNPAATGKFSWTAADASTSLDPTADLQYATKYIFTISPTARSKGGASMATAFTFAFTTEDRPPPTPRIVATEPDDGSTGVAVGAAIAVTFDQQMDAAATEGAIAVNPAAQGAMTWDSSGKRVALAPAAPLLEGLSYSVTVGTDARSKAGIALPTAHVFSFTTESRKDSTPPVISHTPPGSVQEGTPLEIVASVIDDSGVGVVRLRFRSGGQSGFTLLAMERGDSDMFSATIPGASVQVDRVEYYVEASDLAGNTGKSPAGAPTSFHTVEVRAAPSPPTTPKSGFDWTLLLIVLAITLAAIALIGFAGSRRRRPRCRWCGSEHPSSTACLPRGGGW